MTQTTWGQKVTWPPPRAPSNPRPNMQYAYSWYSWQRSLFHGSPWPLVCGWDCSKLKRLTRVAGDRVLQPGDCLSSDTSCRSSSMFAELTS